MYDDNRYEVECKYTQYVNLSSRPTWPRLDMAPLAAVLNKFEAKFSSAAGGSAAAGTSDIQAAGDNTAAAAKRSGSSLGMRWVVDSFTDTGGGADVLYCTHHTLCHVVAM